MDTIDPALLNLSLDLDGIAQAGTLEHEPFSPFSPFSIRAHEATIPVTDPIPVPDASILAPYDDGYQMSTDVMPEDQPSTRRNDIACWLGAVLDSDDLQEVDTHCNPSMSTEEYPLGQVFGGLQNVQPPGTYSVECHTDIVQLYECWILPTSFPKGNAFTAHEISKLWNSAFAHLNDILNQASHDSDTDLSRFLFESHPDVAYWRTMLNCVVSLIKYGNGNFSTSANQENLLTELVAMVGSMETLRLRCIVECHVDPENKLPGNVVMGGFTTDSCNTSDNDDALYTDMRRRLELFQLDQTRVTFKTEWIYARRLRRDIRAWARISGYRCMKLADNSMLIHKDRDALPRRTRRPSFGSLSCQVSDPVWDYRDQNAGYSSATSFGSRVSVAASVGSKKRRLPRDEGGYACDFPGCHKTFDRQCDLSHHQRSHRPKDTLPYPCESCELRFPFPKDLRRHEKKHHSKGTDEDR